MPKPLTRPQPTSSVASMLEPGVGAQVLARPEAPVAPMLAVAMQSGAAAPHPVKDAIRASGEVPAIPRQFTLTARTDRTLKRLIAVYSEATGLDLKHSELLRAILVAIEHAMPELLREAHGIGRLRRPKNDRGREGEREELERRIAAAFVAAMRAAAMMQS